MGLDRYNEIQTDNNTLDSIDITTSIPKPKKINFTRGYITRYFIQKSNDTSAPIYEVSADNVTSYANNPLYVTVSLDWRLTGEKSEIKKSNQISIRLASKVIPKIGLYLPNLLQFHQK